MDHQELLYEVKSLGFIPSEETADAAIKAVLGILVSSIDEPRAKAHGKAAGAIDP